MEEENKKEQIAIIGAGSWGTSLANLLGDKGYPVKLWVFEEELFHHMKKERENIDYLPGVVLSDHVTPFHSLEEAVDACDVVVSASPSHTVRSVMKTVSSYLADNAFVISVSKGIEEDSLMTMSEVLADVLPERFHDRLLVLSGPSFAKEVSQKKPTAVVIASENEELARCGQNIFNTPYFRVYTNDDMRGVELAGTYKNVIAIATGISDGLGLGLNAKAALMARGLAEISRLGLAMGAYPATFYGLAGIGDLVLTCTGDLSRNRSVGIKLGQGMKLDEILKEMKMVAEGIKNTRSIIRLGEKYRVELPIANQINEFLFQNKNIKEVISELMGRDLKREIDKK